MKVLCVVPSYFPALQYGGPIFSVHGLNKALLQKGVDVTVYTTNVGLEGELLVNQEVNVDGVKVFYFEYVRFFEFVGSTGWQYSPRMTRALKENLKAFDMAYIVAVWNYPVLIAAYYCRKYGKPYIISPRGLLYPVATSKKFWKKLPYYYLVAKRSLKYATGIHYTTEDEVEKCHSSLGLKNKAIVIPNGVSSYQFEDPQRTDKFKNRYRLLNGKKVILFLSRISWKKGLDLLVDAYAKLVEERDDIHLVIVGNDDEGYSKKVKQWVKNHGLNYVDYGCYQQSGIKGGRIKSKNGIRKEAEEKDIKVTFTGMLEGNEKFEALMGSDIFVLASYSENFGMAVVEAMACGIPVIISNQVGIHTKVEENRAGLVTECDAGSVYRCMKLILDDNNLAKKLSENGKRLVSNYYRMDRVSDMMLDLFEKTVSRNQRQNSRL